MEGGEVVGGGPAASGEDVVFPTYERLELRSWRGTKDVTGTGLPPGYTWI